VVTCTGEPQPPLTAGPPVYRIPSTSRILREMGRQEPTHGLVAVADFQTAGEGRLGRRWEAPQGEALCFSVLLAPVEAAAAGSFPLTAGVVAYDAVSALFPDLRASLELKWPNDLLAHGRKLAGILCELDRSSLGQSFLVVGVGVNCLQPEFPPHLAHATSLLIETGTRPDPNALLEQFLTGLDATVRNQGTGSESSVWQPPSPGVTVARWKERSGFWRARSVRWCAGTETYEGTTCDISPTGALVVRLASGEVRELVSGEIHEVRRS
jgi:BirA family biotin operon repressor/biotin-[acetyl-CoA-carboxylase] ligase